MNPLFMAFMMIVVCVALLIGELLLPTYGILGILGLAAFGVAIWSFFVHDPYLGLGIFVLAMMASPFLAAWFVRMWPKTPVGRRVLLPDVPEPVPVPPAVHLGQEGVALSEMRPMGECEFGSQRVEAVSEHGIIAAGSSIKVVAVQDGRPVVRVMTAPIASEARLSNA